MEVRILPAGGKIPGRLTASRETLTLATVVRIHPREYSVSPRSSGEERHSAKVEDARSNRAGGVSLGRMGVWVMHDGRRGVQAAVCRTENAGSNPARRFGS